MKRFSVAIAVLLPLCCSQVWAEPGNKADSNDDKVVSGMSIVGNNETPKSLVIIPWKSSEIGQENNLKSNLMNDGLAPVDRDVFMRELEFFKLSNSQ